MVIRAQSGALFGRSFTLTEPKVVGRAVSCDIRIDDPALAERQAQFELHGDKIVLRALADGELTTVNGVPVRDAVLSPGDQIVIDSYRFLLEAPGLPLRGQDSVRGAGAMAHTQTIKTVRPPQAGRDGNPASGHGPAQQPPPSDPGALWWLIAAAAVLAAAMTALLVYSPNMGAA